MKHVSRRAACVVFTLLLCAAMSACVKTSVSVKVNPDATGHIVLSRVYGKEVVAMYAAQLKQMEDMMARMGDAAASGMDIPDDPFYNEKLLRKQAGLFGPGVEFFKGAKYDRGESRGYIAIYKFKDVNDIFINVKDLFQDPGMMSMAMRRGDDEMEIADKEDDAFEFRLNGADSKKLTVVVPAYPAPDPVNDSEESASEADKPAFEGQEGAMGMQQMTAMGNPFGFTGQETQGQAVQKMMKGFSQTVSVELKASAQESNAAHKRKTKKGGISYVLVDMDMDKLLMSTEGKNRILSDSLGMVGPTGAESPVEFYGNLNGVSGVELQTNNLVISFK